VIRNRQTKVEFKDKLKFRGKVVSGQEKMRVGEGVTL
jgi:hypothetical protein